MLSLFKKENSLYLVFLIFILGVYLILRIPGVHSPYHQDEYKWPMYANSELVAPGMVPHPPLTEFIYTWTRVIFGDDNFRLTPLFFSVLNIGILYFLVRRRYGNFVAGASIFMFTFSFFGLLASLTVDTDGAILPFFFLLSLWFYDSFLKEDNNSRKKILWFLLMMASMLLGLLIKMSFILPMGAIALDFILINRQRVTKKSLFLLTLIGAIFISLFLSILYLSEFIFPGFSIIRGVKYWETFFRAFTDRNFLQTLIQVVKGLIYLSPILVLPVVLSLGKTFNKARVFYLYIFVGLFFYLILLDFSIGALDRYLAFLVIPSVVIASLWLEDKVYILKKIRPLHLLVTLGLSLGVIIIQFLPHTLLPLHPKTFWIKSFLSGAWNFLFPFSGGSGPIPFYISWLFIMAIWILSILCFWAIFFVSREKWKVFSLTFILVLSFSYNLIFMEEFLWGKINGSTRSLVTRSAEYIKNNSSIKEVIVYNDNGAYEIKKTGKYARRLYAVPGFEPTYQKVFSDFSGHILLINIPIIYNNSFYTEYLLSSCKKVYSDKSGYIESNIYKCSPLKDVQG